MLSNTTLPDTLVEECEEARGAGLLHGLVVAVGGRESQDLCWAWGDAAVSPVCRPMAVDAIFDVASVTKVVATTSACAVCIDRGLLDPDAPVAHYLPSIGQFADHPIRVRELATHASGYGNRKFNHFGADGILRAAVDSPPERLPGERFEYSCRNFLILGQLVEQITGEDLASFCAEHLFTPLGMRDTRFGPLDPVSDRVVPTDMPAGTIADPQARLAPRAVGNAGLFTTAHDLATFCRMILNGGTAQGRTILHERSLRWLLHPCNDAGLPRHAFGWNMRPAGDCPQRPTALTDAAIGHGGWTGQSVWIDPQLGLYVIVLTNRTHVATPVETHDDSERIRARIADHLIALWREMR